MSTSRFVVTATLTGALCFGCDSGRPQQQPEQPDRSVAIAKSPAIIDAKLAATCVVTFGCFLSHPGLGSSGSSSSVDLATCTRTRTSHDGPYDDGAARPTPDGSNGSSGSNAGAKLPQPVSPETCAQITALVAAITVDEARAAQEAAQIDTTACSLTVTCPQNAQSALRIQRQTTTGGSRVEQLIRAVH